MSTVDVDSHRVRLDAAPVALTAIFFHAAEIREALGRLTETRLEVFMPEKPEALGTFLGKEVFFSVLTEDESWRQFGGTCISAEAQGYIDGAHRYLLELRPKLWMLTRRRDSRVFQDMTTEDIVRGVLGDAGIDTSSDWSLSGSYPTRPYCVQYRETDFDFVARLLQEEGIYWMPKVENDKETTVFKDTIGGHTPLQGRATYDFIDRFAQYREREDHVFEWLSSQAITTGKVTLDDYNPDTPETDLTAMSSEERGTHAYKSFEHYEIPARYQEVSRGETFAKVIAQRLSWPAETREGVCDIRTMATGGRFTLAKHVTESENQEYLVIEAVHHLQARPDLADDVRERDGKMLPNHIVFAKDNRDNYRCRFKAIPAQTQFRPVPDAPQPRVPGFLTAVVTGPKDKDLHTDDQGRIKVQFHWDRKGENDEKTSCFVRVATPWSGNGWGFFALPRIGQEVMIQFEDGDPDRPICTGMLYNGKLKAPYSHPGNASQQGIRTNSMEKEGGFNELTMEDAKGKQFVFFQSEKDYEQKVKNNAKISIGVEKADKGDLEMTVQNDVTEDIGNDETRTIGNNQTETIGNDQTETIGNNMKKDIGAKEERTVGTSQTLSVGTKQDVDIGTAMTMNVGTKALIKANQEIKLQVGGNSITINQMGITIDATKVDVKGKTVTNVQGSISLILKGGMTLIN